MKSLIQRFLSLVAFPLLVLFAAARSPAFGADIVWSSPITISGGGDVSTDGSLVAAFNMNGPDVTVNGVTFSAFAVTDQSHVANNGNFAFEENQGVILAPNGLGSGLPSFSNLNANYQTLLSTAISADERDVLVLTISGLSIGQQYQFQWWCNASTLAPNNEGPGVSSGALPALCMLFRTSTLRGCTPLSTGDTWT